MPTKVRREARAKRQGKPSFAERELKDLDSRVKAQVEAAVSTLSVVPTGCVMPYAGATPPPGYLLCNGQTISASTYPELAAVLGTTYGGTAANPMVPDLKGRQVVGAGTASTPIAWVWNIGDKYGFEQITLINNQIPSHDHGGTRTTATEPAHNHGGGGNTDSIGGHNHNVGANQQVNTGVGGSSSRLTTLQGGTGGDVNVATTSEPGHNHHFDIPNGGGHSHTVTIGSVGGDGAHDNTFPSTCLNYIIKT